MDRSQALLAAARGFRGAHFLGGRFVPCNVYRETFPVNALEAEGRRIARFSALWKLAIFDPNHSSGFLPRPSPQAPVRTAQRVRWCLRP